MKFMYETVVALALLFMAEYLLPSVFFLPLNTPRGFPLKSISTTVADALIRAF